MRLLDHIEDILKYIQDHSGILDYNGRLLRMWEGQILPEVEESLKREMSDRTFQAMKDRIPPINVLRRIMDKLSRVYSQAPDRRVDEKYQERLSKLEKAICINDSMSLVDTMLNLHKFCAIEPYLKNEMPALRVIPGDRCLAWSSNLIDPLTPEVFIKFVGKELNLPSQGQVSTDSGEYTKDEDVRYVDTMLLYSKAEIGIFDTEGNPRPDLASKHGMSSAIVTNPFGEIPILYLNRSHFRLVPLPDTDLLHMTILFPKMLADLNYAAQFQCHSLFVGTDIEVPEEISFGPNKLATFNSIVDEEGNSKNGSIDVLTPKVNIDQVLELLKTTLILWLESRHIKAGSMGKTSEQRASGVAKIIDEADATQFRTRQTVVFDKIEQKLWPFLSRWVDFKRSKGQLTELPSLPSDINIDVIFGDQMPLESSEDRLRRVESFNNMGVMTPELIIEQGMPGLSPNLVKQWVDKVTKYRQEFDIDRQNTQKGTGEGNQEDIEASDSSRSGEDSEGEDQGR